MRGIQDCGVSGSGHRLCRAGWSSRRIGARRVERGAGTREGTSFWGACGRPRRPAKKACELGGLAGGRGPPQRVGRPGAGTTGFGFYGQKRRSGVLELRIQTLVGVNGAGAKRKTFGNCRPTYVGRSAHGGVERQRGGSAVALRRAPERSRSASRASAAWQDPDVGRPQAQPDGFGRDDGVRPGHLSRVHPMAVCWAGGFAGFGRRA